MPYELRSWKACKLIPSANTMSFSLPYFFQIILHVLLLCSFSSSQTPSDLDSICNDTLYPSFCIAMLTGNQLPTKTIRDYGRFCISQSLSMTKIFKLIVNQHLQSSNQKNASEITKLALQDCQFLTSLNIEYLSTTANIIKPTNSLGSTNIDDAHTLLSAALTNLDTCSDGLKEAQSQSSIVQDLSPQISNGTMLLSLTLALFTKGWVPKSDPNGYMPFKFSDIISTRVDNFGKKGRRMVQIGEIDIMVNTTVVVNPNGSRDFTTINDAIAAAPINRKPNSGYFEIYVEAGVYEEYVNIPSNKKYLLLVGDGINKTIITGNHSVADKERTTYNSSTFAVTAVGFVAKDITFRNTAGAIKHQAVAVRNGADLSAFHRCSFEGYQDTLYAHSKRQFYKECDIYGTVDFIFGNAAAVFQNCNIYARQPLEGQFNLITAQGRTDPNQNTGISIQNSIIKAANDLASSTFVVETYLGRPWKEYSRTVYMQSFLDNLIVPVGWHEWNGSFALNTLYYAEYNNTGLGSNTANRVTWPGYHVIDQTIASYFTVSYFIVGDFWLPSTGVPYTLGLF